MEIFQYLEKYFNEISEIYEFLVVDSLDASGFLQSADEFTEKLLEGNLKSNTYNITNPDKGAIIPSGLSISYERRSKRNGGTLNIMWGISGPEPGVCLDGSKGIWREYTDNELQEISRKSSNNGIIAQLYKWNLLTWRLYDKEIGRDIYTSNADLALAFVEPDKGFGKELYTTKSLNRFLESTRESRISRIYALQYPELWDVYGSKELADIILSLNTKE